jgi:hypothetical protein
MTSTNMMSLSLRYLSFSRCRSFSLSLSLARQLLLSGLTFTGQVDNILHAKFKDCSSNSSSCDNETKILPMETVLTLRQTILTEPRFPRRTHHSTNRDSTLLSALPGGFFTLVRAKALSAAAPYISIRQFCIALFCTLQTKLPQSGR